jgi:outer membrane protein insertion porin family
MPKTIQFNGDPEYSTDELLAASGLQKGETLSYAQMNDTSKRLMDTGMFASLTFKFDGQDLVFQLTPADQLVPIHLDNLPVVSVAEVNDRVHQQFPLYHGKVPSEGGLLEQVRASVEAMLAAQGIRATVLAAPGADSKTHHVDSMHFSLASPPVLVSVQQIDGAAAEFAEQLRTIADQTGKVPFDTDHSAANVERAFTIFYEDRGYAAVKVHVERAGDARVDAAAITVPYKVKIEEGRVYQVGAIHVPDNTPITQDEIAKTLAPTPHGPVTGARVRTVWEIIAKRYHAKGYLDCKITPTPHFDDAKATVNYDVAVDPGPVYHLAFVKFENVSDELRRLLIKNWQLLPGDAFNETYVSEFLVTAQQNDPVLRRTLAAVKATYNATADPQTHDVNVVLRLEKR